MTRSRQVKEQQYQDISEEAVDQILAETHSISKKLSNGLSVVNENSFSNEDSTSLHATKHQRFGDVAEKLTDRPLISSRPASLAVSRKPSQNNP